MKTQDIALCFSLLFIPVTAVLSQNVITPLFPLKDGTISPDSSSGDRKDLVVDQARQAAGWMVFKSASMYYRDIGSAMLAVFITSVQKPGLCGIHAIMTKITAPENGVSPADVKFDDMPIAALPLDSTFSAQMILVNITELVQSRAFYGIALRSIRDLSARFSSKEGFPPPAILVYRDSLNPSLQPKWWSGTEVPDMEVGKTGDFFVRALKGIIYRKSSGAWDSVASLTIPAEQPVVEQSKKTFRHPRPARRRTRL